MERGECWLSRPGYCTSTLVGGGGEESGEHDQDMIGRIAILESEVDRLEVQLEMQDDQDDQESPPDYSALSHSNSLR